MKIKKNLSGLSLPNKKEIQEISSSKTQNKSYSGESNLEFIYDLYKHMFRENLHLAYQGEFNVNITDRLLELSEKNLTYIDVEKKVKKKVYHIMVECLQNICKHQDKISETSKDRAGIFMISKYDNQYCITSGNLIENKNISFLKDKLNQINSLDKEELKRAYRVILEDGQFSKKGGAGLGLMDIARKSGRKLTFDFETLDKKTSYFYFQTTLPFGTESNGNAKNENDTNNIEIALKFHKIMRSNNLLLVYEGEFSQEVVLNVLSMAEGNIKDNINLVRIRKNVFNIITEILQNVCKHADELNPDDKVSGLFVIAEDPPNNYIVTSGNLIMNDKIEPLRSRINKINSLDTDGLNSFYDKEITQDENISYKGGARLGLIDLALKSCQKLEYNFIPINKNISFYSLQVSVAKI